MAKTYKIDMTSGPILPKLLKLALKPLCLTVVDIFTPVAFRN